MDGKKNSTDARFPLNSGGQMERALNHLDGGSEHALPGAKNHLTALDVKAGHVL
jgi:hypothetical protein